MMTYRCLRHIPHLIRYSDRHVVLSLGHKHLYLGQIVGLAVGLYRCTHGVLEQFEQYMVEVGRWVDHFQPTLLSFSILLKYLTFKRNGVPMALCK